MMFGELTFGPYGGRFVPETLSAALVELAQGYDHFKSDEGFQRRLQELLRNFVGRPTPLYFAQRLSARGGGARIFLKREDLNHTGAHKINNALGQTLLATALGKRRVIAETGAGQHGVATATAAALLGLPCRIFMGEVDVARQRPNVNRMELLGAEVVPVTSGSRTLKDAINAAMRAWVEAVDDTHYIVGSVVGPDPYPRMVRDFQAVIGHEARGQCLEAWRSLPECVVACVGGGSNAIGMFHAFLSDESVELLGVEAGGHGLRTSHHAATLSVGRAGILHGARTIVLQDEDGQIQEAHSVSAGLDYPGVGPEHAFLRDSGRVRYSSINDREALEAFTTLSRLEGIIPALESAHAIALATKHAATRDSSQRIVICLSGRGDKDLDYVQSLT